MTPTKTVYILAREQHCGKLFRIISWDGSRRVECDGWINPCGHIDHYSTVRREAKKNGLNNGEAV